MAESAEDGEIVASLQARAQWSLLEERAPEVADRIGRLRIPCRRRKVVFVAGVPFVDQPVQPLVAHSGSPVENRERAVGTEIADQVGVLEPRSARGDGRRGRRRGQRNYGAPGDEGGENQRALGLDQALSRKWARVPDLTPAGPARVSPIDDS